MILLTALAVAVLFGAGIALLVSRDAVRIAAGTLLVSNAAVLLLVSTGFAGDETPLLPVEDPSAVADPLVQALALTAVVIGFGTTVLLVRVAKALESSHGSIDVEELVEAEVGDEEAAGEERED